jgi:uncharacterized membrane protein
VDANLSEWLNLLVRWVHVFAGILWIGQTYFFTWLDGRLTEEEKTAGGQKNRTTPQVWMVHSGGFYVVEKQKGAELLPRRLHWFRWEAAITWLSGMALLIIVYYLGGLMVDDTVARISLGQAVGVGVGLLVLAWFVYDFLVQSPLARNERLLAVVGFLLLVGVTVGLTRMFSGRAAYMHVGALLGTIMTANVWLRILPAQRRMLARARQGQPPDPLLSGRAKLRTKHNTYLVVPVVLIMVSNHLPTATYGSQYNWIILGLLILVGWAAARLLRRAQDSHRGTETQRE